MQFVLDFKMGDVYTSPEYEASIYKGIPMKYRDHPVIKKFLKSGDYYVRYRGNSVKGVYRRDPNHCLKQFAKTFSIYQRNNYVK